MTFRTAEVSVSGETATWDMTADSGGVKTRTFCPVCGVAVYLTFAAMPAFLAVRAGTLDEPAVFKPQAVTYGVRGLGWDYLEPGLPVFDRMPTG